VIPKFVRKKFAGVQQPLGRWIFRHVVEFIVLSPAILVTWLWLKIRRKQVLLIGRGSSTITAFVMPLEVVLRRLVKSNCDLRKLVVLNMSTDANAQIRKMYNRVVRIIGEEDKFRRRLFWWASILGRQQLPRVDILETQNDPLWHTGKPVVSLNQEELKSGDDFLRSIGVKDGQKIVCYTVRSSSYYQKLIESGVNLKPQTTRNPDESIYHEVAKILSLRGYFVIRMGKDLAAKLPRDLEKHIYDYATLARADFLDVYILNKCEFLLNGGTGMFIFRAISNLPTIYGDVYRVLKTFFFDDLSLFQKVWLERENRLATVGEMVAMGDSFSDERHQERLGVRLVKNTAEEILAACDEMEARLNGTWVTTEEDEILQKKYWDLICDSGHHGGRIGAQFLRDNQDLLR
jgi:putative glycosyltransferase (TIGR04372 family)